MNNSVSRNSIFRLSSLVLPVFLCTLTTCDVWTQRNSTTVEEARYSSQSGEITGTIFCRDTGMPARGARVSIQSLESNARPMPPFVTDLEGKYNATHLRPGTYAVTVQLNGYLSPLPDGTDNAVRGNTQSKGTIITVRANSSEAVNLTLERAGAISGHVTFDDGSPAILATLRLERLEEVRSSPSQPFDVIVHPADRGSTDDRGNFRMATLAPGRYRVAAIPRMPTSSASLSVDPESYDSSRTLPSVALEIFSPSTIHRTEARTINLRAGEEISGVDISIPLTGLHKVSGWASSPSGDLPNSGFVWMTDQSDRDVVFGTPIDGGRFTFQGIPEGTYFLVTRQVGHCAVSGATTNRDECDVLYSNISQTVIVSDGDVDDLHLIIDRMR